VRKLIVAGYGKLGVEFGLRREGELVFEYGFLCEDFESDAFDAAGGAGEIFVDQTLAESDGFEDLSAAVAL